MADDIQEWLENIELGKYLEIFVENDIEFEVLAELSDGDLKELGLSLGHRRKFLKAIRGLSPEPEVLPSTTEASGTGPERRHLTVMFCDLVGSTALSSRLDPEDMRELLRAYQDACTAVVMRYEGFVAKYMGDGVLIYFGYPQAHEDDAERAINAGLGIVDAVKELQRDLFVRIGIATGMVVVGDIVGEGASQEAAITGETPNLAARLQDLARPDAVVIAEATYSLVGGLFDFEDLGLYDLKGFDERVQVWGVSGARRAESRFEATHSEHLTALTGRDEEMEILARRWERAKAGEGQVVLLSGEPGLGKSRLVRELETRIGEDSYYRFRHQCSPYHAVSALYPIIDRLERAAGFEDGDAVGTKLDKLEALIAQSGKPIQNIAPFFASLLSIPTDARYPASNVSPQRQKALTLEAIIDQLAGLSEQRPVLFIVEDAHWIDPTTLELMELVVERARTLSVLILITHRLGFNVPWSGHSHVTQLALRRLDVRDCEQLVNLVVGSQTLPQSVRQRIAMQTDGVPLFVEELTKSVLESAAVSDNVSAAMEIPATLQDSLMARLDRLGPAKEVAQVGAVIGREFRRDLLTSVSELDATALDEAIVRLTGSGMIYPRQSGSNVTYAFNQALVQGTAYGSLLRNRRAEIHGRVAACLARNFPEIVESEPELLAHHYGEAESVDLAVDHWQMAGQHAMKRSANIEAEGHIRKGLEILASMPETSERHRREIALLNTLGVCLMPTRGFGNPEVAETFSKAALISEAEGDMQGLFVALRGKGQYQMISGDLVTAKEQTSAILDLAEKLEEPDLLIEAHHLGWSSLTFTGDFVAAREHVETGIALYDRDRDHHLTYAYSGHDPGVCCRSFGSLALWQLGYPDQALVLCRDGEALARELSHPFTLTAALWALGSMHLLRREFGEIGAIGEFLIDHCGEMGFQPFVSLGHIFRGGAAAYQGKFREGTIEMREGILGMRSTGTKYTLPLFLTWLAELHLKASQIEDGFNMIEEGLAMAEEDGDCFSLPEFHRIRGDLLLAGATMREAEAEDAFTKAAGIARDHKAKSLELRAVTCLARLWHSQGKTTEARTLLASIYGWFTEGFDTADLKEAKVLLKVLS
jgi:class 3 adenylate cyclase/predicted ATPase